MLVSAIMPTRGRRELIWTAIDCFLRQDYAPRELVILDDAEDVSIPMWLPSDALGYGPGVTVRYFRQPGRTIGSKLDWLSNEAKGEVILRFDSDDWYASHRISTQVHRLQETGKGLTGCHSLLFWDQQNLQGYRWTYGAPPFCTGTSMAYTKAWWREHRWPEFGDATGKIAGTDCLLARNAAKDGSLDSIDGGQMIVARAHGGNTSTAKRITTLAWPRIPRSEFPQAFFAAI